jgi:hypothetical protein
VRCIYYNAQTLVSKYPKVIRRLCCHDSDHDGIAHRAKFSHGKITTSSPASSEFAFARTVKAGWHFCHRQKAPKREQWYCEARRSATDGKAGCLCLEIWAISKIGWRNCGHHIRHAVAAAPAFHYQSQGQFDRRSPQISGTPKCHSAAAKHLAQSVGLSSRSARAGLCAQQRGRRSVGLESYQRTCYRFYFRLARSFGLPRTKLFAFPSRHALAASRCQHRPGAGLRACEFGELSTCCHSRECGNPDSFGENAGADGTVRSVSKKFRPSFNGWPHRSKHL